MLESLRMLESLSAKVPFGAKVSLKVALIAIAVVLTVFGFQSTAPMLAGIGWLVVSILELTELLKMIGQHLMFQRIQKAVMAEIDKEARMKDAVEAFDSAFGLGLRQRLGEATADLEAGAPAALAAARGDKKDTN